MLLSCSHSHESFTLHPPCLLKVHLNEGAGGAVLVCQRDRLLIPPLSQPLQDSICCILGSLLPNRQRMHAMQQLGRNLGLYINSTVRRGGQGGPSHEPAHRFHGVTFPWCMCMCMHAWSCWGLASELVECVSYAPVGMQHSTPLACWCHLANACLVCWLTDSGRHTLQVI